MATFEDLPLVWQTPVEWAENALQNQLALLNDHAHLEKKAATNALALLNQWPEPDPPEDWVNVLTLIAKVEAEHLAIVTRLLRKRGGELSRIHKNPYANALRKEIRLGEGKSELVDRLLVSALIELRSCERFCLLAEASTDPELAKLYKSLWASEHGHYKVFLRLAHKVLPPKKVKVRWQEMLEAESRIVRSQPPGPGIHTGIGASS